MRIAFAALLLVLPAQLAIRYVIGAEPFPALFLPAFSAVLEKDSVVEYTTRSVEAESSDGDIVVLDGGALLTGSGGGSVAFTRLLSDPANVDEDTVDWLRQRLRAAYPDLELRSISIIGRSWTFDGTTGERSLLDSRVENRIELGGKG